MENTNQPLDIVRVGSLNLPAAVGALVSLAGVIILLEWTFGIKLIALFSPTDSSMKANTSIVFLLFGLSLLFYQSTDFGQKTARWLAVAGIAIAALTLSQYIFRVNLGIDEILFLDNPNPDITSSPGRMSPLVAFNFILTGTALVFWKQRTENNMRLAEYFGIAALVMPFIVTLGYLFRAASLYSFSTVTGVALITSILFMILLIGILAVRTKSGLVTILLSETRGGKFLRFLFPTVFAALISLDWLIWRAAQAGMFSENLVVPLGTITTGTVISVLIWRSAKILYEADLKEKKSFAELQTAYQTAEEANRAKDEFISVVSHELRTPLNAILGWMRIIKDKPSEENLQRAFEVVSRQSEIQLKLVEDLLDTSRIISGKMRLEISPVQIEPIISEAIDSIRPAAEAKNIKVILEAQTQIPNLKGDGGRLLQVFWNLLSNSVKFTPNGGEIKIEIISEKSNVRITVSDTGNGIEPDLLPFVFERFRQADFSHSRRTGGLGLGLSLVKSIVELHGGSIFAKSDGQGKGSAFVVRLPIYVKKEVE
jgi:signal transduction histidine kinase